MPRIRLTGPNGEVKTVRVSEVPNDAQMNELSTKIFGQLSETPKESISSQPLLRENAQSLELARDIEEEKNRPGVGQFFSEAASSGKKEVGNLIDLSVKFAKNPIQSSKKIAKMAKNLTKEDAAEFGVGLAKDFGKTFGFDIDRPGNGLDKFDIDTAIDRWRSQPIGAIGDAAIFCQP